MGKKEACSNCGSKNVGIARGEHRFFESGLRNVILLNAEISTCKDCGEKAVSIPNPNQLLKLIGEQIILNPSRLSGEEIRFLRKNIYLKTQEFSQVLGVHRGTISRWENGHSKPTASEDRLIRMVYAQYAKVSKGVAESLKAMLRKRISEKVAKYDLACNVYPEITCQRSLPQLA